MMHLHPIFPSDCLRMSIGWEEKKSLQEHIISKFQIPKWKVTLNGLAARIMINISLLSSKDYVSS